VLPLTLKPFADTCQYCTSQLDSRGGVPAPSWTQRPVLSVEDRRRATDRVLERAGVAGRDERADIEVVGAAGSRAVD